MNLRTLWEALRPQQWVKNVILLLPLLFAVRIGDLRAWELAGLALLSFCLVASATYIVNDVFDRRSDRVHPAKRLRPIASGRLGIPAALVEAGVLLVLGGLTAWAVGPAFTLVIGAYLLLQTLYNIRLKRLMLIDAICLSCGFVLRAVGGAVAIRVVISPWLVICTFSLCLFLAFAKRHCEIQTLADGDEALRHRKTLGHYTPGLLNHLITLSGGMAIICFLLYATSPHTQQLFGTDFFIYTVPLVFYGITRVAMLCMRGAYDDPTELFLRDRPLQVTGLLWLASAAVIVLYGVAIKAWLIEHFMTSRSAMLCLALAISGVVLAVTWRDLPCLCTDSDHYIELAEGRPQNVMKPFSNRVLEPAAVRGLSMLTGLDTHQAFFAWGLISLVVLTSAVALLLRDNCVPAPAVVAAAVLLSPYLLTAFTQYYLPDLFHAALLACFLLAAAHAGPRPGLWLAALVLLLLAWLARESTLLMAACLFIVALRRRQPWTALGVAAASVAALGVVWLASRSGKSNIHGLNELVYLALKVPFCFCRNVLGVQLWTNTYAANQATYPPPVWACELPAWLPLGSIRSVGVCAFLPLVPLQTAVAMLTVFGVLPAVLWAVLRRAGRRVLAESPAWLSATVAYGVVSYFLGTMIGVNAARYVGYAWPAFWVATPLLLFQRPLAPRDCLRLLACQVLVVWGACVLGTLGGGATWPALATLVGALALHVQAYRIVRYAPGGPASPAQVEPAGSIV